MKDWRILILPIVLLLAITALEVAILILDLVTLAGGSPTFSAHWIGIAVLGVTLAYNWLVTGLIIGKLWWSNRRISDTGPNKQLARDYSGIIIALAESGIIYSLAILGYIVTNFIDSVSVPVSTYTI